MNKYMVLCTFTPGTEMSDVYAVVAEEQAKASQLQLEGKIGSIHLATISRGTVFIEVNATTDEEATAIVQSLPMSQWWNIDVYPLSAPSKPGADS